MTYRATEIVFPNGDELVIAADNLETLKRYFNILTLNRKVLALDMVDDVRITMESNRKRLRTGCE